MTVPMKPTTVSLPNCRDCGIDRDETFKGNRCVACHRIYYANWIKANKNSKSRDLPCPMCTTIFRQNRKDKLFCSNLCRDRYRYAVKQGNPTPTLHTIKTRPYRVRPPGSQIKFIPNDTWFSKHQSIEWIGSILARDKNGYCMVSMDEIFVDLIGHYTSIGGPETKIGKPQEQLARMWTICKLWYNKQMAKYEQV